jgi:hypothetical protein
MFAHLDPDGVVWSLEASWYDIDARLREALPKETLSDIQEGQENEGDQQLSVDSLEDLQPNKEQGMENQTPSTDTDVESNEQPDDEQPTDVRDSMIGGSLADTLKTGLEASGTKSKHELWSVLVRLCSSAEELMQFIYNTYLTDESPTQICMSTKVMTNTLRRISQFSVSAHSVSVLLSPKCCMHRFMGPTYLARL